jgi:hypothetical protein
MAQTMTIAIWMTTALVAAEPAFGRRLDLLQIPYVRTIMAHLGYPTCLAISWESGKCLTRCGY